MAEFFDFHRYVERWCEIYKPMMHVPGDKSKRKRFFITESFYGLQDFMRQYLNDKHSPVCIMESGESGMLTRGSELDKPTYTIYFFVLAKEMGRGFAALDAKNEAKMHMKKLIAFLMHQKYVKEDERLRNLDLEDLNYQFVGPVYNGWYGIYTTITDVVQNEICLQEDDYSEEFELEEDFNDDLGEEESNDLPEEQGD